MKNVLIIISTIILLGCTSSAQDKGIDVPKNVQNAFDKKYPGVEFQKWEMDKNDYYEARYIKDGIDYRADFTEDGTWIETEQDYTFDALPDKVKDVIDRDYKKYKIIEIELVDNAKKGIFYDVELKKDGTKRDVMIREDGIIIK